MPLKKLSKNELKEINGASISESEAEKELCDDVIPIKKKRGRKRKENYVDPEIFKSQILQYYGDGILKEELGKAIHDIATRLGFAPNFINYCVDEETEALTKRGWLKYNEINTNDTILSYDIKTDQLVWSKIKDIFINEKYDGLMHKLTTDGLDALVTPGHKFISKENGLKAVEHIICKEHIILTGSPVKDAQLNYTDDFVELVGWAVTEGHYKHRKRSCSISIYQKDGPKSDNIRNCLKRLNVKYSQRLGKQKLWSFHIMKEHANRIIEVAPNKILSMEFILNLTQQQRIKLIHTMVAGDGWTVKRENYTGMRYTQKDKQHIDSFIALCTIAGLTTGTHLRKIYGNNLVKYITTNGESTIYVVNIFANPKRYCMAEYINFHGGRPKPGGNQRGTNPIGKFSKPNIPTQKYTGVIWCPQTEYGTFICRRGAYVYATSNTYKEEMVGDAVIKMLHALKNKKYDQNKGNPFSYYTKIAFNAFCNRIKKEKRNHQAIMEYQSSVYETLIHTGNIPDDHMEDGDGEGAYNDF